MDKGFGKYDVYTTSGSIYCYRDTNVLKNRFGLHYGKKLTSLQSGRTICCPIRYRGDLQQITYAGFINIYSVISIPLLAISVGKIL